MTGAAGFLGSRFAEHMLDHGYHVVGVDRDDADLSKKGNTYSLLRWHKPKLVVHFAGQVGRQFCEDNPEQALRDNVLTTLHVATACREIGAQLAYCSTSEVYGDGGDGLREEHGPLCGDLFPPSGVYALSKKHAEEVARLYGPPRLKIFRPSMPYGPGAPPGRGRRALDNMLWQAHHRMPITVHMGSERSWCYITDVMRAMRLVIESGKPGAYNIGRDDARVSMLTVADMACGMAGAPRSLIRMAIPPPGQTAIKRLSTEKLRRLGWAPVVDLEEGMRRVYDWIKNFDSEGNWVDEAEVA